MSMSANAADFEKSAIDGWHLSLQGWTYNWLTVVEVIDKAKELGIEYIEEFPGQKISKDVPGGFDQNMSAAATKVVQDKLAETGCKIVAFGVTGVPGDEKGLRKMLDWAKSWGIGVINTEVGKGQFPLMDKLAGEYGIKFALHNHPKGASQYWSPDIVLAAIQGYPNIGDCADTGHWARSNLVPVECLKKLEGHVFHFHFKDLGANKVDKPWGTGVNDARGQLEEAKRQNFKGCFSIEYETGRGDKQLDDHVRACVEWWFKTVAEIAAEK